MHELEEIVSRACWFPVSIDPEKSQIRFVQTSRERLDSCAFHDGRTPIALNGNAATLDIDEALQWHYSGKGEHSPLRIVAHTSFCGSTLLSRLLSLETKNCAYREPQILAELSNLKNEKHALTQSSDRWEALVAFAYQQFTLCWPDQQAAIIKPSNWANTLLADLGKRHDLRLVQISSDIESYLCANLRGGKPRISYSLKLLNHLSQARTSIESAITEIDQMQLPGIANILHLLALCLLVQEAEFDANKEQASRVLAISKRDLMVNPGSTANCAARTLNIDETCNADESLQRALRTNAKTDKQASYSSTEENLQNSWLKREYAVELEAACSWFEEHRAKRGPTSPSLTARAGNER